MDFGCFIFNSLKEEMFWKHNQPKISKLTSEQQNYAFACRVVPSLILQTQKAPIQLSAKYHLALPCSDVYDSNSQDSLSAPSVTNAQGSRLELLTPCVLCQPHVKQMHDIFRALSPAEFSITSHDTATLTTGFLGAFQKQAAALVHHVFQY